MDLRFLRKLPGRDEPSKFDKHAGRLSIVELRAWGMTVAAWAAERCEKAALDVRDDVAEIRDAAAGLRAVADELERRDALRRRNT